MLFAFALSCSASCALRRACSARATWRRIVCSYSSTSLRICLMRSTSRLIVKIFSNSVISSGEVSPFIFIYRYFKSLSSRCTFGCRASHRAIDINPITTKQVTKNTVSVFESEPSIWRWLCHLGDSSLGISISDTASRKFFTSANTSDCRSAVVVIDSFFPSNVVLH